MEDKKNELVKPTHTPNGKFAKGNDLGGKNPYTKYIQAFQRCILTSVKQKELKEVMQAMVKKACEGDVNAARLVLERTCGKLPQDAGIQVTNVSKGNMTICIQMEGENDEEPSDIRQNIDSALETKATIIDIQPEENL